MAVYRFRVTFEDAEDVYREIDIQGKQTFEDFHRAIQEAISFDNSKDASFYMSDDFWHHGTEIALNEREVEEDDDDMRNPPPKPKRMSKCRVVEFIDDPHQKIVYVFDPKAHWTLLIELMKIVPEDSKTVYPKCTKSVGAAPKQYKVAIAPPVDEDEFDDPGEDEEEGKKERVFQAEEEYDADDHTDAGEETEAEGETEEGEASEESDSEEAGDVDISAFGGGEDDF